MLFRSAASIESGGEEVERIIGYIDTIQQPYHTERLMHLSLQQANGDIDDAGFIHRTKGKSWQDSFRATCKKRLTNLANS